VATGDINVELDEVKVRGVYKSVSELVKALKIKVRVVESFADGDLTPKVEVSSEKDILGLALVEMKKSLNQLLGQVNQASEQVSSGADQIALSSQDLSQGATEQAASLEEISSTISTINNQSLDNSDKAEEAFLLAKTAMESAVTGNGQMQSLLGSMEMINDSTGEINKVVKIIDDIAFQINLLALNANVEAARAGKYGRGFAVVADEVRNLAVRSAEAVKETTSMVSDAIDNTNKGNKIALSTADQLKGIVENSRKISALLDEIKGASREQTDGIDMMTKALEQINNVTQQNVANAEESSASSEELSGQANLLLELIRRFQLDRESIEFRNNQEFDSSRLLMAEIDGF
jgi:methyl-accepting chemotaxis protein